MRLFIKNPTSLNYIMTRLLDTFYQICNLMTYALHNGFLRDLIEAPYIYILFIYLFIYLFIF